MKLIFQNFDENSKIYISIDNKPFQIINNLEIEIFLSSGKHTVKILNKHDKDIMYSNVFLFKQKIEKNIIFAGINYEFKTLLYIYDILVINNRGTVVFKFDSKKDKNYFNYSNNNNIINVITKNSTIISENVKFFKSRKEKNKFIFIQLIGLAYGFSFYLIFLIINFVLALDNYKNPMITYYSNNETVKLYGQYNNSPVFSMAFSVSLLIVIFILFLYYVYKLKNLIKKDIVYDIDTLRQWEQRDS